MLICLAIAWMLGIVAAAQLPLPAGWLWGLVLASALGTLSMRAHPWLRTLSLMLLCAALGGLRYQAGTPLAGPTDVRLLAGTSEIRLAGEVTGDPRRGEDGQRVVLHAEMAALGGETRHVEGLVLLVLPPYPAYHYGDRLAVTGELKRPRAAERAGEFDYRAYLAHHGIHVLMREPDRVELRPGASGLDPLRVLYDFRERCQQVLLRSLPEPQASLAVGILLGLQSSIPDEVYKTFSATGTSHILVVSGWNFTIVAALLGSLCTQLKLGRWPAFWLALVVMWLYALFTGASAAVLRAAVMASLMVLARTTERQSEPWTLLLAACWLISLVDPHTLWDLGFQLSALATASLFAYARPVEGWFNNRPPLSWAIAAPVREALTATLAAQVLTLPLILYQFGNLSLVAPLANVLLVPVVPYAMLFGALSLLGGLVWLPLGQIIGLLLWLPLSWLSEGARLLAEPSWAAVLIPPFPLWMLLVYYAILAGLWMGRRWYTAGAGRANSDA